MMQGVRFALALVLPILVCLPMFSIGVGDTDQECLWGESCPHFECSIGGDCPQWDRSWGDDTAARWECLWDCPAAPAYGTVAWWQSWQANAGCAAELGSPPAATASCVGAAYCNYNWTGYGVVSDGDPNAHSLKIADSGSSNPTFANTGAWTPSGAGGTFIQFAWYLITGTNALSGLWDLRLQYLWEYLPGSYIYMTAGTINLIHTTGVISLGGCSDTPTGTLTMSSSTQYWLQWDFVELSKITVRLFDNSIPRNKIGEMSCTPSPLFTANLGIDTIQFGFGDGPFYTGLGTRVFDAVRVSVEAQPAWP